MKERDWMELQAEAPLTVNACLHYFQDRYMGDWRSRILEPDAIFAYLQTKGFEIRVSTFGIPNRSDWYCEVYRDGQLIKHERDYKKYDLAAMDAIMTAFVELEKVYGS